MSPRSTSLGIVPLSICFPLPCVGSYFHPQHEECVYVTLTEDAPGAGLWLSRDNGKTWQPFNDLPFSNIQRVEFSPFDVHTIHVTTFGGGVWCGRATP